MNEVAANVSLEDRKRGRIENITHIIPTRAVMGDSVYQLPDKGSETSLVLL